MTRIKICGITRLEDALYAARLGVHALGFVFAPSPRQVTADQARAIIRRLPPFITPVGVFVDCPAEELVRVAAYCALGAIQLHGQESPADCTGFPLPVIKAIRVRDRRWHELAQTYKVQALLLDTYRPDRPGGTGQSFNWDWLRPTPSGEGEANQALSVPIILAGGLNPDNVEAALQQVQPYGIDVSSGVEVAPGQKDHQKMEALVGRIRAYNG